MQRTGSPWTSVLSGLFLLSVTLVHAAEITIGGHTFTLPDGFTIESVAAPPLVERPISADFDEQGRLYVTDSSGSNNKVEKQLEEKPHRIVRLEDTDKDGKFDRSMVFADRLMFPEGAMWLDGSLYVAAPPSIWKLTDTDGDGVADKREEWFKGGTLTGCANDLHGPYRGPDGWIYWCKGAFAEQTHQLDGHPPMRDRAAHIFRCRPDGSGLEVVMSGGMDNPVEVAFTPEGEPIFTSTFLDLSGPGKRDGLGHAVLGGVFPKVNEVAEGVPRTGPLLPAMTHFGPGAPSGLCRYQAEVFGREYRDNLFATLFNLHKVTCHALEPSGATFRTRDRDFLTSSNLDFHPTDVLEDADGSLLIVDTGGWYKLCCPTSQLAKPDVLGAIYRIRRVDAPAINDPRGAKLDWATLGVDATADLLKDARPAAVQRAADQLTRIGASALPALQKLFQKSDHTTALQHALWILARIGTDDARRTLREAFSHSDPRVRQTAVRASGILHDPDAAELLATIVKQSADDAETAHLRRAAAEALARIRDPRAVPALLEAAASVGDDRFLEHAITFALIETGDAESTAAGLGADKPAATRCAALVALNEMERRPLRPDQISAFLNASDEKVRDIALWTLGRRSDAGAILAAFLPTELSKPNLSNSAAAQLETLLVRSVQVSEIQTFVSQVLWNGESPARKIALRAISKLTAKNIPEPWIQGILTSLEHPEPELLPVLLSAARTIASQKDLAARVIPPVLRLAQNESLSPELRLEALAAIPSIACDTNGQLFNFLCAQVEQAPSVPTRTVAGTVLARAKLNEEQRGKLADMLPRLGVAELSNVLPAFDSAASNLAERVINSLAQSPALTSLPPQVLRAVLAKFPSSTQKASDQLLTRLNVDATQQRATLDAIAAELPKGDVRKGQAIFNSAKAACSACHSMGYLGGKLGPDLTTIGTVRNERDLLEAIVFPSASFVRSYEPATVRLKNGDEITGILRGEGSDAVTLAVGAGTEQRFPRSEIGSVQPGATSLMPQGYDQILTRQELADLLEFLKATKWGPR